MLSFLLVIWTSVVVELLNGSSVVLYLSSLGAVFMSFNTFLPVYCDILGISLDPAFLIVIVFI